MLCCFQAVLRRPAAVMSAEFGLPASRKTMFESLMGMVVDDIEQSIAAARASVMVYDDLNKKWVPSGSSSGLSKVHIYQHVLNNTFRVVGRKLQDHEVVINCAILKGLKYNQATATFHQWRDNKNVYGLNFSSKEDADAFALAMIRALEILSANQQRPPPGQAPPLPPGGSVPQQPQQNLYQYVNGPNSDYEDLDYQRYRGPRDEMMMGDRRLINQHMPPQTVNHSVSGPPTPAAAPLPTVSAASSAGHHRTSSAPPAPAPPGTAPAPPPPPPPTPPAAPPAPPPMPMGGSAGMPSAGPPPPPAPAGKAPPPPPPPPAPGSLLGGSGMDGDIGGGSLANALANAKLRKTSLKSIDSESPYGTTKGPAAERPQLGGMASMMDEMAKTLARRRAACESVGGSYVDTESKELTTPDGKRGWDKASTNGTNGKNGQSSSNGGAESPKGRKRFGSTSGMEDLRGEGGGDSFEMERMKAEILAEIRKEMQKMKQEIIDAIKVELNRR